jgi:hypothetical protein
MTNGSAQAIACAASGCLLAFQQAGWPLRLALIKAQFRLWRARGLPARQVALAFFWLGSLSGSVD